MATRKRGGVKARKATKKAAKKAVPAKRAAPKRAAAAAKPAAPPAAKPIKARSKPESLRLRAMMASLTVNDLAKSVAFYRDGLGFVVSEEWNDEGKLVGYMLKAGTIELGIGQDDWAKGRDRVKGVGLRLYCETTQDVDAFAARVKKQGYSLADEVANSHWGSRGFTVVDPDGFRISIFRKIPKK
jgi:lactoylglutathione lyase